MVQISPELLDVKYGISERIRTMREELLDRAPEICAERALIYTQTYQENEADPPILKRAKSFKATLEKMSIFIYQNELLVGNQASKFRGAPIFPEYSWDWIVNELDEFSQRKGDVFLISEETKKILLEEVIPYWKGKTLYDRAKQIIPSFVVDAQNIGVISGRGNITSGDGHIITDIPKVLEKGLEGILQEIKEKRESLAITDSEYIKKSIFYKAAALTIEGLMNFIERYAQLATLEAKAIDNQQRKKELLTIAENLQVIAKHPPISFYQALQLVWFIHLATQIESNGHSFSLGRLDQYLYSFWNKDVVSGKINKDFTIELLQNLFIKMFTINKVRPWAHTQFGMGYTTYQNVTIGGQDSQGQDATNELSILILKAVGGVKLTTPNLSARYHAGAPRYYLDECVRVIQLGFGMPAMKNDEIIIPALLDKGVIIEDARNYAIVGCVEAAVPGKWGYRNTGMAFLNALKVLELTLYGGRSPIHKNVCLFPSKDPTECTSFEEFYQEFMKQLSFYTQCEVTMDSGADTALEEMVPDAFCSTLVDDCLLRGKSIKEGGAVYDVISGPFSGLANVANSLVTIRKFIYEDKTISWKNLLYALQDNFESLPNQALLRKITEELPKYGNDDDYADKLAYRVLEDYLNEIKKYKNTRYNRGPIGSNYCGSTSNISANVPSGRVIGATPDGRKATEPIAEGVSPFYSTERRGPTAVLKSVSKLPTIKMIAQLLNLKFTPSVLAAEDGRKRLVDLIVAFFRDLKGWHVQFNVVDVATLKEAQKNPEKYRDLIVRVAGYSALFIALDARTQEDIIRRTEHLL